MPYRESNAPIHADPNRRTLRHWLLCMAISAVFCGGVTFFALHTETAPSAREQTETEARAHIHRLHPRASIDGVSCTVGEGPFGGVRFVTANGHFQARCAIVVDRTESVLFCTAGHGCAE